MLFRSGDDGPWAGFRGSDLIHLALGGVMKNCGYDPDPGLNYDLPPIAPQIWHAYHICGEQMAVGIIAALIHRLHSGAGQDVACAVHEAVAKNTERRASRASGTVKNRIRMCGSPAVPNSNAVPSETTDTGSCTRPPGRRTSDRKSTRLNSSHIPLSRMPSSA